MRRITCKHFLDFSNFFFSHRKKKKNKKNKQKHNTIGNYMEIAFFLFLLFFDVWETPKKIRLGTGFARQLEEKQRQYPSGV